MRNERVRDLLVKDKEFERNQMALQSLYEKLNHLAEYDRNLKFELTLYRGVLESEHRRKQPPYSNRHPPRPTVLRMSATRSHRASTEELPLAVASSQVERSDDETTLARTDQTISIRATDLSNQQMQTDTVPETPNSPNASDIEEASTSPDTLQSTNPTGN